MALIMNEMYQARQRAILRWMMNAEYNIIDMEDALRYIYKVIEARREFRDSTTPESEALARWRMSDARNALKGYLMAHLFPGDIRDAAVWLSEHTP